MHLCAGAFFLLFFFVEDSHVIDILVFISVVNLQGKSPDLFGNSSEMFITLGSPMLKK